MRILIFILCFSLVLGLIGCTSAPGANQISIKQSIEEMPVISGKLGAENVFTFQYQGYLIIKTNIDSKYVALLKKLTIKDIKYEENKNGLPVLYRFNRMFNFDDIRIIYKQTVDGIVNNMYEYTPDQFKDFGFTQTEKNEYTTRLQYLIMGVDSKVDKDKVKRKLSFNMIFEFSNGKKVEKPFETVVP